MAFSLSCSFNVSITRDSSPTLFPTLSSIPSFHRATSQHSTTSPITCFSKKHHHHHHNHITKELIYQHDTSAPTIGERIMNQLFKSAIPIIVCSVQITLLLPFSDSLSYVSPAAKAVLYSPDTKVPRTGEVALRKAIPANANMKAIQDTLEDISYLLRIPQRKPYGTMEGNVKKALKIAVDEKDSILASIPAELKERGTMVHATLIDGKGGLQALLQSIKEQDADKVSMNLASTLDTVAEVELLQAPGLSFLLPKQYMQYPRLSGRGTVEFTIEKGDGSTFSPVGGEQRNTATIQV
ncbi:peptidyl-prolyl cis-trans isomerase CYP37, chloroplastic-like [Gastrolobium bilobum]|uniref:peptidyl-prolyl cis-trans isomerase CYP37, chloroplastic-like n=1 Tax=Gastrolobium bilobum TaxID=150636 RepID=UPI002AB06521|nr:peptidyl-prolyl cis-trans isomerase CYP37, chloroplastic-like [Gastrolobium bilobum]